MHRGCSHDCGWCAVVGVVCSVVAWSRNAIAPSLMRRPLVACSSRPGRRHRRRQAQVCESARVQWSSGAVIRASCVHAARPSRALHRVAVKVCVSGVELAGILPSGASMAAPSGSAPAENGALLELHGLRASGAAFAATWKTWGQPGRPGLRWEILRILPALDYDMSKPHGRTCDRVCEMWFRWEGVLGYLQMPVDLHYGSAAHSLSQRRGDAQDLDKKSTGSRRTCCYCSCWAWASRQAMCARVTWPPACSRPSSTAPSAGTSASASVSRRCRTTCQQVQRARRC